MKTKIATYLTIISTVLLFIPLSAVAQKAQASIDKEFVWTDANKTESLYIDVKKKSTTLLMSFAGAIEKGTLEVTVFNPQGEKIPIFLLLSDESGEGNFRVEISSGENDNERNKSWKVSGDENDKGTQTTTTTSSTGSSTSITTTSTSKSGSSSTVSLGKSSSGSSHAVSSSGSSSKGAKGIMSKVLSDPAPGKWKLVISLKNVTGKLEVGFEQE